MKKKIFKAIKIILLTLFLLLLSSIILNFIFTKYDKSKYSIYGEYITVNNKKMYVSVLGKGSNTIVILPGAGCVGTVELYRPLAKELAKTNRVVIVEYFGYGFSDDTSEERTIENIVSEIRLCLKKLEISNNIILMPHSQSGLYSLYYAENYPDEIKAIIGLDMTLAEYEYDIDYELLENKLGITENEYNSIYNRYPLILDALVNKTGLMRWFEGIYNNAEYKELEQYNLYSDDEIRAFRKELKIYPSKALLNELKSTPNMLSQMRYHKYPSNLHVLQFLNTDNAKILPEEFGTDYEGINQQMITNTNIQKYEIVQGKHSTIFLDGLDEIVEKSNEFIESID